LRFIGVTHPIKGPTEQQPKIAFGQHSERAGRLLVPVGMQVNHIFIDGAAMEKLVERVQEIYRDPAAALAS
jgi:chloramphenicol O-acetyltransferase